MISLRDTQSHVWNDRGRVLSHEVGMVHCGSSGTRSGGPPPSWDMVTLHIELEELGSFSEPPAHCMQDLHAWPWEDSLLFSPYKRNQHKLLCLPKQAVMKFGKEVFYKLSKHPVHSDIIHHSGRRTRETLSTRSALLHLLSMAFLTICSPASGQCLTRLQSSACWDKSKGCLSLVGFHPRGLWHYLSALQREAWNYRAARKAVQSEVSYAKLHHQAHTNG